MARDEKMTVGRYLKRNTLYIVLGTLLAALAAALVFVLVLLFRTPEPAPQLPVEQETVQTPPVEEEDPVENEPEPPVTQEPEVFQPPFLGRTKFLADQKLALTYDDDVLQLTEQDGLYTLLLRSGASVPRMDIQQLSGALSDLSDDDLRWLAVSILQAYYYLPPSADEIVCSEETITASSYAVTMAAPALADAAAARSKVQLFQIGEQLWYVSLLIPEGCDGTALEQAYDNLVIR